MENEEPIDKFGVSQESGTFAPGEGGEKERKVTIYQHTWADKKGYLGPSTKGEDTGYFGSGKSSVGLLYGKAEASSKLDYNLNKGEVNLTPVNVKVQFSVVHADADGNFKLGSWYALL